RTQKLSEGDLRVDHLLGWSPDGRSLALDSRDVLEVSSSENGTLGIGTGFYSRQWVLDPPTQALQLSPEPLFGRHAGEPRARTISADFHWHSNGTIYYRMTGTKRTDVIVRATPGDAGKPISDSRWGLSTISFADSAEVAAGVRESVNDPPELALVDLRTGNLTTLTSLNAPIAALNHPRVDPFRVTNRFGYATDNWLIPPANYDPNKRYPL